jgi:hypothetical protein
MDTSTLTEPRTAVASDAVAFEAYQWREKATSKPKKHATTTRRSLRVRRIGTLPDRFGLAARGLGPVIWLTVGSVVDQLLSP